MEELFHCHTLLALSLGLCVALGLMVVFQRKRPG